MVDKIEYTADDFKRVQENGNDLISLFSARDTQIDEMRKIYLLKDEKADAMKQQFHNVVDTRSPDGANAIETATRLMTANYPGYNVPEDMHKQGMQPDLLDRIEKYCQMMMRHSDEVRGNPVHVDAARFGLLDDEIIISVNSTKALLEYAGSDKKAPSYRRIERLARVTPFLFDVVSARDCYYEHDYAGLRSFLWKREMTGRQIVDQFPEGGERALGTYKGRKITDKYEVRMAWDLAWYACYISDCSEPIVMRPWTSSFIPWVVKIVEGSRLFSKVDEQRRPFLYTMWKSGMYNRQNISLSAIFTNVQTALWAQLDYEADETDGDLTIDTTTPLGIIRHPKGTNLRAWNKNLIDPALWQAWQLAEQKGTESTIYKQVAGQALGAGATFSETALLNQAGRLPLTAVQRKLPGALGEALQLAFMWMKEDGGTYKAGERGQVYDLSAAEIPDDLTIDVSLDPSLPQDRLQMANVAKMLQGVVSRKYILNELFHVRQPDAMIQEMYEDQTRDVLIQHAIQNLIAPPQPQAPAGPPPQPGITPGPGAPAGLPPQMMDGGMGGPLPPAFEQQMEG